MAMVIVIISDGGRGRGPAGHLWPSRSTASRPIFPDYDHFVPNRDQPENTSLNGNKMCQNNEYRSE